jgi:pimeloyl-ACP methyl ester carboxylesterase
MAEPMSDLIVVIPGIGGSVLARDGRAVWSPRPGAAMRAALTLGRSIGSLSLRGDDPDLDDLGDGVTAPSLVPDLHILPGLDWKIDGYGRLRRRLFERFDLEEGRNYLEFPYDWRRDNRVAARKLAALVRPRLDAWRQTSGNPDARLILVGHSMGGIVARLFLEFHEGWKLTRRLVTFGTPYSGSVNALDFVVNGFRKGWGPLSVDLSSMLRTFTSVYQLLPSYRCLDSDDGWKLLDEVGPLPNVDGARLADSLALHRRLRAAVDAAGPPLSRYDIRPVVGDTQRTKWGARLRGGGVEVRYDRGPGQDGGDGTVPRVSAVPHELLEGWRNVAFFSEKHASLQNDGPVFEHLSGVLRVVPLERRDVFPAGDTPVALEVDDASTPEPLAIRALPRDPVASLVATVESVADGSTRRVPLTQDPDGWHTAEVPGLPSGDYRVRLGGPGLRAVTGIASVVDLAELEPVLDG